MRKCRRFMPIAAGLLVPACAAFGQTTLYQTGFEAPPFAAGATLQRVDAWVVRSGPTGVGDPLFGVAQTSQFAAGAQAAALQGDLSPLNSGWAWRPINFDPTGAGMPFVTVTWTMNVGATGTLTLAGMEFYSASPFVRLGAIGVNSGGDVLYLAGGVYTPTAASVVRGQWHSFRAVLDYSGHSIDFFVDSVGVASGVPFPAGTNFGDADLWKGGTGTAHIYYDNFKIVADDSAGCYPDCNGDGALTVQDFGCFQTKFVQGDAYADCNGDGQLTVQDFGCYQTKFVQGCP